MKNVVMGAMFLCGMIVGFAEVTPAEPFIHVEGEAKKWVAPNQVQISFDIMTSALSYEEAVTTNDSEFNQFLSFLKEHQIDSQSVESYRLNVDAVKNSWEHKGELVYECERDVKMTITNLEKFPQVLDELHRKESLDNVYISFQSTNEKALEDELLELAISNAREKADKICDKMNMRVKGVYAISDEHFHNIESRFIPRPHSSRMYSSVSEDGGRKYLMPSEIGFSNWIYVIYTIEPKAD